MQGGIEQGVFLEHPDLIDFELSEMLQPQSDIIPMAAVKDIPELEYIHEQALSVAEGLLSDRRRMNQAGRHERVPLDVDAMSTARALAEIGKEHGKESKEYAELYSGLTMDTTRLIGEARRRNSFEYFPKLRHETRPDEVGFFADGRSLMDIVANGVSPSAEIEEQERRINDFAHESATYALLKEASVQSVPVSELRAFYISECPDFVIKKYKNDLERGVKGTYDGYVPSTEKLGIVMFSFDKNGEAREEEQVLIPGTSISHDLIVQQAKVQGIFEQSEGPTKSDVHGQLIVVNEADFNSVLDVAEWLDTAASEATGKTIRMGEVHPSDTVFSYEDVPVWAESRRLLQEKDTKHLTDYLVKLGEQGVPHSQAIVRISSMLETMMHDVAKASPEEAAIIFDVETAQGYQQVLDLRAQGLMEDATVLELKTMDEAPAVGGYCGADSCGLEHAYGSNTQKAIEMKLNAFKDGKFIKDKVRSCRGCGETSIVYGSNGSGCTSCGTTKINGKLKHSDDHEEKPTFLQKMKGEEIEKKDDAEEESQEHLATVTSLDSRRQQPQVADPQQHASLVA